MSICEKTVIHNCINNVEHTSHRNDLSSRSLFFSVHPLSMPNWISRKNFHESLFIRICTATSYTINHFWNIQ